MLRFLLPALALLAFCTAQPLAAQHNHSHGHVHTGMEADLIGAWVEVVDESSKAAAKTFVFRDNHSVMASQGGSKEESTWKFDASTETIYIANRASGGSIQFRVELLQDDRLVLLYTGEDGEARMEFRASGR